MTPMTVARVALLALGLGLAPLGATALAADAQPTIVPAGKSDKGYATGDMVLGKADAPVTVVEYASMTCPHCAAFHAENLPKLKSEYIDSGKVRLVFREYPLDKFALYASMLARCAGPQRYFDFVNVLFQQQASWVRAKDQLVELKKLARLGGIGEEAFNACMADEKLRDEIIASRLNGEKVHGITATPGFVVNGKTVDAGSVMEAVAEAVKKTG
jgi:protein-disulfide isomerase